MPGGGLYNGQALFVRLPFELPVCVGAHGQRLMLSFAVMLLHGDHDCMYCLLCRHWIVWVRCYAVFLTGSGMRLPMVLSICTAYSSRLIPARFALRSRARRVVAESSTARLIVSVFMVVFPVMLIACRSPVARGEAGFAQRIC